MRDISNDERALSKTPDRVLISGVDVAPRKLICNIRAKRRRVLNVDVDAIDQQTVIRTIISWCDKGKTEIFVNPNLDCVAKLEDFAQLRLVYNEAELVIADGWPLALWSWIKGTPVPCVAGSDLIVPLCRVAAEANKSVFIFGTSLASLAGAAKRLKRQLPTLEIAGVYSPPFGFENSPQQAAEALAAINAAAPDIVFLALGAPKQELWAHTIRGSVRCNALVCVGAAIDFLSGRVRRAPTIVRRLRFEWFWRLLQEPRRLGPRYVKLILRIPILLWRYG